VLGRINPDYFLGGETRLDVGLARKAVLERAAKPAGLELIQAAQAIIDIANAKMTSALYFISVEQGIDPRGYVLVPSGGAGPMQAVAIARALGVRTVLIPPTPGLNSAVGLLATDLKHEFVRTYMKQASQTDPAHLAAVFDEMEKSARGLLREEGVTLERTRIVRRDRDVLCRAILQLRSKSRIASTAKHGSRWPRRSTSAMRRLTVLPTSASRCSSSTCA